MVVLISVFGSFSGSGLGTFNLAIYEAIGYDSNMQFILNLMTTILATLSAVTSAALSDRVPRRKVLVVGTFLCAFWLGINGGLYKVWVDNNMKGIIDLSVGRGAAAAFFLFAITYSFTYVPLLALYPVCPRFSSPLAVADVPTGRVSRQCDSREGYGHAQCNRRSPYLRQQFCDSCGSEYHQIQLYLLLRRMGFPRIYHLVLLRCRNCGPYARGVGRGL